MSSLERGEIPPRGKNYGREGKQGGSVIVARIKGFARVRSFLFPSFLPFLLLFAAGEINSHGGGPSHSCRLILES